MSKAVRERTQRWLEGAVIGHVIEPLANRHLAEVMLALDLVGPPHLFG